MKDARGHGSNPHGAALQSLNRLDRNMFGATAGSRVLKSEAQDNKAAQALAGNHPKSMPAPVHDAHGGAYAYERDEYNRDLSLRLRDGQVGSGMRHRP